MSTWIVFSALFIFVSLSGCQTPLSNETGDNLAPQPSGYILPLEMMKDSWNQFLKEVPEREPSSKLSWQEELQQICSEEENLCEQSTRSSRRKEILLKSQFTEAKAKIKEENFEVLSQYSVDFGLKLFGKMKESQMIEYSKILQKDSECKTTSLRHGLASMLEDHLPNEEVRSEVLSLYEANSLCPISKTVAQSSYRAAMLRLLESKCDTAIPLLHKVSTSTEDYLKSRAAYWSWKCQGESDSLKANIATQLPYFSYHRLLLDSMTPQTSHGLLNASTEQTPIIMESKKLKVLNRVARLAERLIASEQNYPARVVLEKIKLDRVQETEPEFQVYYAFLLNESHSGIRKFQILSAILNSDPRYRTKAVKSMLFPNSYFEYVEATTKTLDPWLIQALIRQESAFDPRAKSRVGATGLMQLMPATARRVARLNRNQLKDPAHNVQAGVKYLEKLVSKFDGQVHLALAAYNAGSGKVEEWVKRYPTSDTMLFVDTIPYRETREYVAFILRNYHWYRSLNPGQVMGPESTPKEEYFSDPDSMRTLFF